MKSLLSVFALLISSFSLLAQPTLTGAANNFVAGDSSDQLIVNPVPASFSPGPTGANVTWNFANLTPSDTTLIDIKANNNQDYPKADINFEYQGIKQFYATNPDSLVFYGAELNSSGITNTNGEQFLKYPVNYNDSYTDDFSGTGTNSTGTANRSGKINVTADGYGTLKLPSGNYSNAMRIQIIRKDSAFAFGSLLRSSTDTLYFWYDNKSNFPLMTYITGETFPTILSFRDSVSNGMPLSENSVSSFVNMYPNPASEKLTLTNNSAQNQTVKLINSAGIVVEEISLKAAEKFTVDVSGLAHGLYLLQAQNRQGQTVESKKVIIR